uniref:Zinc finger protein 384 a n=1 Tax=Fundulus heteroclitus TaxID=8078 RepID=A0A3Q2T580_FUNHE
MDDSHFNSSYFWSPVPTVQGQIENAMFLNKAKEQLGPDKGNAPPFPHSSASSTSSPHYPTAVLAIPGSVDGGGGVRVVPKQEGGGNTSGGGGGGGNSGNASLSGVGGHLHQSHTSQNVTVVPVPSTGIMTAAGLVITTPQGTLVPTASTQSFVTGPPTATTMIVSAVHHSNTGSAPRHFAPDSFNSIQFNYIYIAPIHETCHLKREREKGKRDCACCMFVLNHTEAKPHKCPHCSKSFANSSYLSQHIRIHTGAKPYTCSYCQKTFRQLSHLQQHTRYWHGRGWVAADHLCSCVCMFGAGSWRTINPCETAWFFYFCCNHPGCEKAFTQLSNLQSHRRQHNKDKPFKCHNCNRGYTDAASLEVHLSTHTVKHAKLFSCGLCNRSYTSVRPQTFSFISVFVTGSKSEMIEKRVNKKLILHHYILPTNHNADPGTKLHPLQRVHRARFLFNF